jgi:hypothetical protein
VSDGGGIALAVGVNDSVDAKAGVPETDGVAISGTELESEADCRAAFESGGGRGVAETEGMGDPVSQLVRMTGAVVIVAIAVADLEMDNEGSEESLANGVVWIRNCRKEVSGNAADVIEIAESLGSRVGVSLGDCVCVGESVMFPIGSGVIDPIEL